MRACPNVIRCGELSRMATLIRFSSLSGRANEGRKSYEGQRKRRYLYRAVDSTGQTINFLLIARRDDTAAKRFFRKALTAANVSI
jgi:hypothetical protein